MFTKDIKQYIPTSLNSSKPYYALIRRIPLTFIFPQIWWALQTALNNDIRTKVMLLNSWNCITKNVMKFHPSVSILILWTQMELCMETGNKLVQKRHVEYPGRLGWLGMRFHYTSVFRQYSWSCIQLTPVPHCWVEQKQITHMYKFLIK